jgi:hypothetical protein
MAEENQVAFDAKVWAHESRQQIDAVIQRFKGIKDLPYAENPLSKGGIRELKLAYTKLQEAKMWTGKILEELGSELPAEFRDEAPQK